MPAPPGRSAARRLCQLRRGELLGLRRRDIDILRRRLDSRHSNDDDGGQDGGEGTEDRRGSPDGCIPGNILSVLETTSLTMSLRSLMRWCSR